MIRAVLFDIDNTLVDYSSAHHACISELLSDRGYRGDDFRLMLNDLIKSNRRGHRDRRDYSNYVAQKYPQLFSTGTEFWNYYAPTLIQKIHPNLRTITLVGRLAATFQLGIVSNGSENRQKEKLSRSGLAQFFKPSAVCVSSAAGIEKPDTRIFELVLKKLGVGASEAIFVGDDPLCDVAGAARCGLATCWIHTDQPRDSFPPDLPAPTWTINKLDQLVEILI